MVDTSTPGLRPEETRAERKQRAISSAAATVFLRYGYVGASMDEIAALAGVSKQTVYKHFADKERLFTAIVTATVREVSDPVHDEILSLQQTGHLETDLRDLALRQLRMVMQPRVLELRRLVIGEASRFPSLGRTFYELGPGRTVAALSTVFEGLGARGLLDLEDPKQAAEHFNWLVMSAPLNRAMLLGDAEPPSADEFEQYAASGVRVFLSAYGRR